MSYLNSVSLVGFVGSDPEQGQARNNGSKFTVLSVAMQRSWKNTDDEWASKTEWHRVCVIWNQSQGQSPRQRTNPWNDIALWRVDHEVARDNVPANRGCLDCT